MQWPTRPLPPEAPEENFLKLLQLQNRIFTHFSVCTVNKAHAFKPVDNNNDMPFPNQKSIYNSLNVWVAAKTKNAPHPLSNAGKNASTCDDASPPDDVI